jgi:NADP-dependent 3-hydroxy acid dehydrogenase YdfG
MSQLDDIESNIIDDITDTNLSGVIHMTHTTLPYLRSEDEAIIMNIVSKSGIIAQE